MISVFESQVHRSKVGDTTMVCNQRHMLQTRVQIQVGQETTTKIDCDLYFVLCSGEQQTQILCTYSYAYKMAEEEAWFLYPCCCAMCSERYEEI